MQVISPFALTTDASTNPGTQKTAEGCEVKEVKMKHISQRQWQKELQYIIPEQFSSIYLTD